MDKLIFLNTNELVELNADELIQIQGGGLGPLWWSPMIRAGLMRYNIVYFKETSMIA